MIRELVTLLPFRWRMTPEEIATINTVASVASRRLKLRRNVMMFGGGGDMDEIDTLIRMFDALRLTRRV